MYVFVSCVVFVSSSVEERLCQILDVKLKIYQSINDDNSYDVGMEHILSSAQSKDREVPQSPRLVNPSPFHEQAVPEANLKPIPSTFSSHGQGSSTGHNAIHYHHHDYYHYQSHMPVGQVRRGNGSSSDTSPMVSKPFEHVIVLIAYTAAVGHGYRVKQ